MSKNDKEERDGKGRFQKGNNSGFSSRPRRLRRWVRRPVAAVGALPLKISRLTRYVLKISLR